MGLQRRGQPHRPRGLPDPVLRARQPAGRRRQSRPRPRPGDRRTGRASGSTTSTCSTPASRRSSPSATSASPSASTCFNVLNEAYVLQRQHRLATSAPTDYVTEITQPAHLPPRRPPELPVSRSLLIRLHGPPGGNPRRFFFAGRGGIHCPRALAGAIPGCDPCSGDMNQSIPRRRLMRHKNLVSSLLLLLLVAGLPASAQPGPAGAASRARSGTRGQARRGRHDHPPQGRRPRSTRNRPTARSRSPPNKNGKWSILGLAGGAWGVLIEKEGFMPSEGQVKVNEFGPAQPINITLKVHSRRRSSRQARGSDSARASSPRRPSRTATRSSAQEKYAEARAAYEKALSTAGGRAPPPILRGIARHLLPGEAAGQGRSTTSRRR